MNNHDTLPIRKLLEGMASKEAQHIPTKPAFLSERPDLDPEIVTAIDTWLLVAIHERRGPGREVDAEHEGFGIEDFLNVLNAVCPEAITRMLQAGAAAYIDIPSHA